MPYYTVIIGYLLLYNVYWYVYMYVVYMCVMSINPLAPGPGKFKWTFSCHFQADFSDW